jgi:EcsC protein family
VRLLQASFREGFRRAYSQVRLDPQKFLRQMRRGSALPIQAWDDARHLSEKIIALHADRIIAKSCRVAALEGLGLGVGGFSTMLPDMGILAAITVRMLQKLSLIYGFEYSTDEEITGFWIAAASAAGVDLGRDFLEKQAVERLVPRIVDMIAIKVSAEVAEKWAARIVPIVSAGAAATINYYFVRSWGRRAQKHFLARRRSLRAGIESNPRKLLLARPLQLGEGSAN